MRRPEAAVGRFESVKVGRLEAVDDAVRGVAGFHLVEDPLLAVAVEQEVMVTEAISSSFGATVS